MTHYIQLPIIHLRSLDLGKARSKNERHTYWLTNNCDALHDLVPFVQFKYEKHPWRSVTFSKVTGFVF